SVAAEKLPPLCTQLPAACEPITSAPAWADPPAMLQVPVPASPTVSGPEITTVAPLLSAYVPTPPMAVPVPMSIAAALSVPPPVCRNVPVPPIDPIDTAPLLVSTPP